MFYSLKVKAKNELTNWLHKQETQSSTFSTTNQCCATFSRHKQKVMSRAHLFPGGSDFNEALKQLPDYEAIL